jgi:hypothetical protein
MIPAQIYLNQSQFENLSTQNHHLLRVELENQDDVDSIQLEFEAFPMLKLNADLGLSFLMSCLLN